MDLSLICLGANLGCYPRERSPKTRKMGAMMFERLLSARKCRCGSGAAASIGVILLLDNDHVAEATVECCTQILGIARL